MVDLTFRYLKTLFDLRDAFTVRRLVWSLENRVQWSMETVARTFRSK